MQDERRGVGRKPGPKSDTPNPDPVVDPVPWDSIPVDLLAHEEKTLREYFKKHGKVLGLRPGERVEGARLRCISLVQSAVDDTGLGWWSGRRREIFVPGTGGLPASPARTAAKFYTLRHVGPKPPTKRPMDWCMWLDTSLEPAVLRRYDKRTRAWMVLFDAVPKEDWASGAAELFGMLASPAGSLTYRLRHLPLLEDSIDRLLTGGGLGRAGHSGKPHYLACAVLAAILDTTPDKISDRLNSHRRARGPGRRKGTIHR